MWQSEFWTSLFEPLCQTGELNAIAFSDCLSVVGNFDGVRA